MIPPIKQAFCARAATLAAGCLAAGCLAGSVRAQPAPEASGDPCATAMQDARALEAPAERARREARHADAAVLFRTLASLWNDAAARCSGAELQVARDKRESAETDAHNAEFCEPLFERAQAEADRSPRPARGEASLHLESMWRDAIVQCRGISQRVAARYANELAHERGQQAPPPTVVPAASAKASAPSTVAASEFTRDNTRFKGSFTADPGGRTYSGSGRIEWANGDVFEGRLLRGQRQGQGRFAWSNGQVYEGDWQDDRPTGSGSMRFANGNRYEGELVDGIPTGRGRMQYAGGDRYEGEFLRGVQNGRGSYVWNDGQRFEGEWKDDHPHGVGVLRYANGNVYEGPVSEGQPHGRGHMAYASGDAYSGAFRYGVADGRGVYTWKGGDRYEGEWVAGAREGEGVMQWANGDRWEGLFRDDQQTATGKLIRKAAAASQSAAKQ